MKDIDKLQKIIDESNYIVFFGGAGVSTSSGIPDFRSKDGLYNQKFKYPPEIMLSSGFFYANTTEFYKFYKDKFNLLNYQPNIVHNYLFKLEQSGKLKAIITQNIDGLHQKAGSKNVLELHGSIYRNRCMNCNKFYDENIVFSSESIPKCSCGGIIKPEVVLYNEGLDENTVLSTIKYISSCDLLIIAGTSLTVYPASGFISYFKGKNLVIINKMTTSFDNSADLVINDDIEKVFKSLK